MSSNEDSKLISGAIAVICAAICLFLLVLIGTGIAH